MEKYWYMVGYVVGSCLLIALIPENRLFRAAWQAYFFFLFGCLAYLISGCAAEPLPAPDQTDAATLPDGTSCTIVYLPCDGGPLACPGAPGRCCEVCQ